MNFPKADIICNINDPLDWTEEKNQTMVAACREMALFHAHNSLELGSLYRRRNFNPETIQTEADLARIPPLGVAAMKHFLMTSLPHDKAVLKLTSSGTRGQKTQIWFDQDSLDRVQNQLWVLWTQEKIISDKPTNYVMFVYDPNEAKDLGVAFSAKNEQRFAPPAETEYAIRRNEKGDWAFDKQHILSSLERFIDQGKPIRLTGIPSFFYEFLLYLKEKNTFLKCPSESFVFTGGGWKAAEDKKVSREYFRSQITELLGIPDENIRDNYGMAEHSAPYITCRKHRFHIPVYNRILMVDPVSMAVVPDGEPGLLNLITPFNAMMPTLAILSTDLGCIDPDPCPCGWQSPTFTLMGRAGLVKAKGCAIHAGEIVKRN